MKQLMQQHELAIPPLSFIQLLQTIPCLLGSCTLDDIFLLFPCHRQCNECQGFPCLLLPCFCRFLRFRLHPLTTHYLPQIPRLQHHPHRELPCPIVGAAVQRLDFVGFFSVLVYA